MKQIIIGHLEQLKDHASGQLVDAQIWLKDFECNGQSKVDAEDLAKEAESRIKEFNDCINFLNGEDLKRTKKSFCECDIPYFPTGDVKHCSKCNKPSAY